MAVAEDCDDAFKDIHFQSRHIISDNDNEAGEDGDESYLVSPLPGATNPESTLGDAQVATFTFQDRLDRKMVGGLTSEPLNNTE